MRLAVKAGLNVWILTDYDIHGINIWRNAKIKIKRLGIGRDTIKWLQENGYPNLTEGDVEEEYSPNPKLFRSNDDPYLLTKRIELDSIIEKVGANAFWKYLIHQLNVEFPGKRDYREIVPKPNARTYFTDEMNDLLYYMEERTESAYHNKWIKIRDEELVNVAGLMDVDDKIISNDKMLKPIVQSDEGIKAISSILKRLIESGDLPKPKYSN